jgi:hypothetical protein
MNRMPVQSSNVASVGFEAGEEPDSGTLEVEFRSGHIYRYEGVPQSEYQALAGASSVGKYMNSNIVGRYQESRVK